MEIKDIKQQIKNEVTPYMIGVRNEIKNTNAILGLIDFALNELAKHEEATSVYLLNKDFTEKELLQMKEFVKSIAPVSGRDYFTKDEIKTFLKAVTPIKGQHYFTEKEIESFLKKITPKKGKHYFDGEPGKTPKKGVDYFTKAEVKEFLKSITPIKGIHFKDGAPGKEGPRGKSGADITAEQLRDKLESLRGGSRLSMKAIKGLDKVIEELRIVAKSAAPVFGGGSEGGGTGGDTSGLVPYTGATTDVDLGLHDLITKKIIITDGYDSPANEAFELFGSTLDDDLHIRKVAGDQKIRLDFSLFGDGLEYIYTLPPEDGVIALRGWVETQDALKQSLSEKDVANGYAGLDSSGKINSSQLPSYVDDVLEYADFGSLPGTGETGIIYVTLDTNKTYRWSGSTYIEISSAPLVTEVIGVVVDGGGSVLSTGIKGYREIPFDCIVTGWKLFGDAAGDVVFDVKKGDYSTYPTTSSIAGSEKPTLASSAKDQNLTLSTWATSLSAGDIVEFSIESVATLQKVTLNLLLTKV